MSTASYNPHQEITQTPQQFQQPPPPPSRTPQPLYVAQPIFVPPQEQHQSQLSPPIVATSTTVVPPPSSSNDKIQANLSKVQAQLNKGGKYGQLVSGQLQIQADALKKVPIVGDINSSGPPTLFHVVKGGSLFSKDDLVTCEDRNQPGYYLEFPHSYRNSWNLTLHSQTKEGPIIANLNKGSYGFTKDDIEIVLANGWKTILTKPSLISKNHQFVGLDGVTIFKWRKDPGILSSTMTLQDLSSGKVAATWQHSYSYNRDGKLLVSSGYDYMRDLLVASCLAMEEWRRVEEESKGSGGSTSTMGLLKMGMAGLKKFK